MLRGAHGREAQQAAAGGIPARGQGAGSFLTAEEAAWEHDLKRLKLGYEDEGRRVSKGRKHNPAEGADSGEEGALLLQLPRPLQPCQPPANSPWKLDIVRGNQQDISVHGGVVTLLIVVTLLSSHQSCHRASCTLFTNWVGR